MLLADPLRQELRGRFVSESGMLSLPVVKDLDVFKAGGPHLGMGSVTKAMDPLVLEAVEPTLGRRVIPAVSFATH